MCKVNSVLDKAKNGPFEIAGDNLKKKKVHVPGITRKKNTLEG